MWETKVYNGEKVNPWKKFGSVGSETSNSNNKNKGRKPPPPGRKKKNGNGKGPPRK